MKLMRIGPFGQEKTAVLVDDSHHVDVSDLVVSYDEAFFASGGIARLREAVAARVHPASARSPRPSWRPAT